MVETEKDVFDSSGDEADQNQSELPPLLASLARGDANAAKMVLAYEISVNEDFQMVNVRENNKSVEGQVASTMERAFWDILRQKLKDGDDEMLLGVIREIREQILNFLAPNSGTRDRIKAQLDMELIQQEWVNGTLDFKELNGNILNILGQLCCPARDEQVIEAKAEKDTITQLSHISTLLQLMRADMSNYAIRQIRPLVQKQHIEQQRQYFEKWAEGRGADATRLTTKWLQQSVIELSKLDRPVKPAVLLQMAYVLSISDIMKVDEWPETLLIERERLSLIGNQLRKQITIAASFLVLAASAPRQYVLVKEQLRSAAKPISDQTDIIELPHSLAELAVQKLSPFNLDQDLIIAIRGQLSSLNDEHPIYKLLWRRASDFLAAIALPTEPNPPETPKGLQNIQTELVSIATAFGKICHLNRLVFGPLYSQIIKALLEQNSLPLTPRKTREIDQMARTPESPRSSAVGQDQPIGSTGLTPRKEKK